MAPVRTRPLRLLLLPGLALVLVGCSNPCANQVVNAIPSPSGQHRAEIFQRDCGATTGLNVHVSILGQAEKLGNTAGNVFVADYNHMPVSLRVVAAWGPDGRLRLGYDPGLRVFRREQRASGVDVEYFSSPSGVPAP